MDAPATASWHTTVPLAEVPTDGTGLTVEIEGRQVALFVQEGHVFAIDDACPHTGGSLGMGIAQGREVTCPWHGMHFDLETGKSTDGLDDCTRAYKTRVDDAGHVEVALEAEGETPRDCG